MAIKDLIPWNHKAREVSFQRTPEVHPFLALHREMNRMFDEVFRGFDVAPFGLASRAPDGLGWPQIDIEETDKEVRIIAELPGLEGRQPGNCKRRTFDLGREEIGVGRQVPSL